ADYPGKAVRDDIAAANDLLVRLHDVDGLELREAVFCPGDETFEIYLAATLYLDRVDVRAGSHEAGDHRAGHHARAEHTDHARALACQILRTHAGNGAGTIGRQKVCRHVGERRTGIGIVERVHQDRTRQTPGPVLDVRAIPFDAGSLETSPEISRHRHETPFRGGFGHVGKRRF